MSSSVVSRTDLYLIIAALFTKRSTFPTSTITFLVLFHFPISKHRVSIDGSYKKYTSSQCNKRGRTFSVVHKIFIYNVFHLMNPKNNRQALVIFYVSVHCILRIIISLNMAYTLNFYSRQNFNLHITRL